MACVQGLQCRLAVPVRAHCLRAPPYEGMLNAHKSDTDAAYKARDAGTCVGGGHADTPVNPASSYSRMCVQLDTTALPNGRSSNLFIQSAGRTSSTIISDQHQIHRV